jgi:hypothetical protein
MSTVVSPREILPYLDFISFSRSCGKSFTLALQSPTDHHLGERQIAFFHMDNQQAVKGQKMQKERDSHPLLWDQLFEP